MKICSKCGATQEIGNFAVRSKTTGRRHSWCNACLKQYKADYYAKHQDKFREYKKVWYPANQDQQRAKCRERYDKCDKDQHAQVVWKNKILREFGLTVEEYNLRLTEQKGVCAICGKADSQRLAVDHCHKTGMIRGLLCRRCNVAIGIFEDDPELLEKALAYLKSACLRA